VQQAKAALAAPPDVDEELPALRVEAARLTEVRAALRARQDALASADREQARAVRQAQQQQRSAVRRALGRGGASIAASVAGGLVGAMLGAFGLILALGQSRTSPLWLLLIAGGVALSTGMLYRLGKTP